VVPELSNSIKDGGCLTYPIAAEALAVSGLSRTYLPDRRRELQNWIRYFGEM
jgi:hypothetical protein